MVGSGSLSRLNYLFTYVEVEPTKRTCVCGRFASKNPKQSCRRRAVVRGSIGHIVVMAGSRERAPAGWSELPGDVLCCLGRRLAVCVLCRAGAACQRRASSHVRGQHHYRERLFAVCLNFCRVLFSDIR